MPGSRKFLNWVCLGGAMHAPGREARDRRLRSRSYIFNSDKCFALFPPVIRYSPSPSSASPSDFPLPASGERVGVRGRAAGVSSFQDVWL